jgi:methionine-rich copper-binding protein CopC
VSGVKDAAGNTLATNRVWSFTTVAADTTAPTVSSTAPANGATNASAGTNVTATFSEAMDATTVSGSTFELRTAANVLVPATVSYSAQVATLNPTADLVEGASYTATMRGGATDPRVKDVAGNAMAANRVWTFTVLNTPPTVASTSPASNATGVSRTANITVTFSEAMTASTISTSTFELRTSAGALVPSVVSYNATTRVATLNPNSSLTILGNYTVTVRGGTTDPRVKDAVGNAMTANRTWSFRAGLL